MTAFCTCPPGGNQVDGSPFALVFGRACERKIYKKMYTVDKVIVAKSIANYRKVASYDDKASVGGI